MNVPAFLNTVSSKARTLPIVILYVTEGCNLRCVTCSYRNALPLELSLDEVRALASDLNALGLRHIVYSGGEPLLRKDFPEIVSVFADFSVKQTLLTNGLLLSRRLPALPGSFEELIVSIDGADALTHDSIRGVPSFDLILKGLDEARKRRIARRYSIRTVLQKSNFHQLPALILLAKRIGIDRISFLAADMMSASFGRDASGSRGESTEVHLSEGEVDAFGEIIEECAVAFRSELEGRFVSPSADGLRRIGQFYRAVNGTSPFPPTICNAPMVSTVVTSTGDVLPCYFLPRIGNIRQTPLRQILNNEAARETRSSVRSQLPDTCRTCVCTLYVRPSAALADHF
jgi:Fe-coproporphyrin III synthase